MSTPLMFAAASGFVTAGLWTSYQYQTYSNSPTASTDSLQLIGEGTKTQPWLQAPDVRKNSISDGQHEKQYFNESYYNRQIALGHELKSG